MATRNLMIVEGGGPTPVLNATLAAIVVEARVGGRFGRILGARAGTRGLAEGRAMDLGGYSERGLSALRKTPGAMLGSSRFRPSAEDINRIVKHLQALEVTDMLFIGGNGTMYGARAVMRSCARAGHEVRVIGVPKTVDNDILETDRCPGYASAARYIAQSTRELGLDLRALPQPITIFEAMGRNAGWLAAASVLAKTGREDAPQLLCLPEVPFEIGSFLARLDNILGQQGWAVVVVSEGIADGEGRKVYEKSDPAQADPLSRPVPGGVGQFLADEVAAHLKVRCRSERPGLLGRSSSLHVSRQDLRDAEAVGRAGVRGLMQGRTGEMAALLPLEGAAEPACRFVGFDRVAGGERQIPAEWLADGPIPIRDGFLAYLKPLVGKLPSFHVPAVDEIRISQGE